jgi:hypothetical protein
LGKYFPRVLPGRGYAKPEDILSSEVVPILETEISHYTMQQSFASMEAKHMQNAW